MTLLDHVHGSCVHPRRVEVLSRHLVNLMTTPCAVLDVGCGDGRLAERLMELAPGLDVKGVEVQLRPGCRIAASSFDGSTLPYANDSFDVVLLVDVLHHTERPEVILREAKRVARQAIVIKDHLRTGLFAYHTLSFMDSVGNARHGVALPRNYWTPDQWSNAFDSLGLSVDTWVASLHLYPLPLDWVFGRSLHFVARLHHA